MSAIAPVFFRFSQRRSSRSPACRHTLIRPDPQSDSHRIRHLHMRQGGDSLVHLCVSLGNSHCVYDICVRLGVRHHVSNDFLRFSFCLWSQIQYQARSQQILSGENALIRREHSGVVSSGCGTHGEEHSHQSWMLILMLKLSWSHHLGWRSEHKSRSDGDFMQ